MLIENNFCVLRGILCWDILFYLALFKMSRSAFLPFEKYIMTLILRLILSAPLCPNAKLCLHEDKRQPL